MYNDLLTTAELCTAAGISRHALKRRAHRYPDLIAPAGVVASNHLWKREVVALLISLKIRKGKQRKHAK